MLLEWLDDLALFYICIPWTSFCKWKFNLVRLIHWIWFSSLLTDIVSPLWHHYSPITGMKVRSGLVMKGTHPEWCNENFTWSKRGKKKNLISAKRPFVMSDYFERVPKKSLYCCWDVSGADICNFYSFTYCIVVVQKQGQAVWNFYIYLTFERNA